MKDFVVIDFETASAQRHSAVSLALVVVRDGEIVDKFYSLLQPSTPFSEQNSRIHGIYPQDVIDAPDFSEVWPYISNFFTDDQLVVAHNAAFDAGVLSATLQYFDLQVPAYRLLDTVRTSRRVHPELTNHKLNTVAAHLQIPLAQHHNALDDASATANILLAQIQSVGSTALADLIKFQV